MAIITLEKERAERCLAEIQAVLQKHNCTIQPYITIIGNQIQQAGFSVNAIPAVPPEFNNNGNLKK